MDHHNQTPKGRPTVTPTPRATTPAYLKVARRGAAPTSRESSAQPTTKRPHNDEDRATKKVRIDTAAAVTPREARQWVTGAIGRSKPVHGHIAGVESTRKLASVAAPRTTNGAPLARTAQPAIAGPSKKDIESMATSADTARRLSSGGGAGLSTMKGMSWAPLLQQQQQQQRPTPDHGQQQAQEQIITPTMSSSSSPLLLQQGPPPPLGLAQPQPQPVLVHPINTNILHDNIPKPSPSPFAPNPLGPAPLAANRGGYYNNLLFDTQRQQHPHTPSNSSTPNPSWRYNTSPHEHLPPSVAEVLSPTRAVPSTSSTGTTFLPREDSAPASGSVSGPYGPNGHPYGHGHASYTSSTPFNQNPNPYAYANTQMVQGPGYLEPVASTSRSAYMHQQGQGQSGVPIPVDEKPKDDPSTPNDKADNGEDNKHDEAKDSTLGDDKKGKKRKRSMDEATYELLVKIAEQNCELRAEISGLRQENIGMRRRVANISETLGVEDVSDSEDECLGPPPGVAPVAASVVALPQGSSGVDADAAIDIDALPDAAPHATGSELALGQASGSGLAVRSKAKKSKRRGPRRTILQRLETIEQDVAECTEGLRDPEANLPPVDVDSRPPVGNVAADANVPRVQVEERTTREIGVRTSLPPASPPPPSAVPDVVTFGPSASSNTGIPASYPFTFNWPPGAIIDVRLPSKVQDDNVQSQDNESSANTDSANAGKPQIRVHGAGSMGDKFVEMMRALLGDAHVELVQDAVMDSHENHNDSQNQEPVQESPEETESREEDAASPEQQRETQCDMEVEVEKEKEVEGEPESEIEKANEIGEHTNEPVNNYGPATIPEQPEQPETHLEESSADANQDIVMGDENRGASDDGAAVAQATAEVEADIVADQSTSEPILAAELHDEEDNQMQTEQDVTQHHEMTQPKVERGVVEPEQLEVVAVRQSPMDVSDVPQNEPGHVEDSVSPKVDTPLPDSTEATPTPAPTEPLTHAIEEKTCEEAMVESESVRAVDAPTTRDPSPLLSSALSSPPPFDEDLSENSSVSGRSGGADTETPNRDDEADEEDGSDDHMDLSPEELAMITRQSQGIMLAVRTAETTSTGRASGSPATLPDPASIVATTSPLSAPVLPASSDPPPETPTSLAEQPSTGHGEVTEDEISNWSDTQNEDRPGSAESENAALMSSTTASSSITLVSEADAELLGKIPTNTHAADIQETIDSSTAQEASSSLVPDVDDFTAVSVSEALLRTPKAPKDSADHAPAPSSHIKTPLSHGKIDLRTIQRRKSNTLMKLTFTPRVQDHEDEEAADDTSMPKFTANVDWSKTTPTRTSETATFTPTESRMLRSGRATPTRPGTPGATAELKTPTRAKASSSSVTPTTQSAPVTANIASTPTSRMAVTPLMLKISKPSTSKLSPREKAVRATAERAIEGLLQAQARSPDKDFSMPMGRKTPMPSPSKAPSRLPELLSTTTYNLRVPSEGTVVSLRQQILGNNHMRSSLTSKSSNQPSDQGVTESVHAETSTCTTTEVVPAVEQDVDMKVDTKVATPPPVSPSPPTIVTEKAEAMDTSVQPASHDHAQEPGPEDVKVASPDPSSTTPSEPLSQEQSTAPPSSLTPLTSQPSVSALDEEDVENQLVDVPPTSPVRQDTVETPQVDIELPSTPVASTMASTGRPKPRPRPRPSVTAPVKKPTPAPEVIYVESSPEKTPKKQLTQGTRSAQSSSRPTTRNATPLVQANSVISIGSSSDDAPPAPPSTQAKGKHRESLAGATVKPEFNTSSIRSSTPKQPVQKLESSKDSEVNPISKSRLKSFNQIAKDIRDMSPLSDISDDPPTPAPVSIRKVKGKRVLELDKYTKSLLQSSTTADSEDEDHLIVKKRRIPSSSRAAMADASAAAGTTAGPRKTSLLLPAKNGQSAAATRVVRKRKAPMDLDAEENMPPLKRAAIRAASRALEGKDVASASTLKPTSSSTAVAQSVSGSGSEPIREKPVPQKKPAGSTPSKRIKAESLSENGRTPTRMRPARTSTVAWPPTPVLNMNQSIECDLCHQWYHWGCAGVNADDPRLQPSELYKCPPCEEGVTGNGSPRKNTNNSRKCARPKCPILLAASKQGSRKKSKEYEVESFVGKCKRMIGETSSGEIQFLVKWVDYSFEDNTWETLEQLELSNDKIFIETLEQQAAKEGVILEEERLKWNEPAYLSEAVKAGWGPDGKFTKP